MGQDRTAKDRTGQEGHSMLTQPPDGQHVTDFAEILHTIWDTKKIPEPEDERSETSETGDMAP